MLDGQRLCELKSSVIIGKILYSSTFFAFMKQFVISGLQISHGTFLLYELTQLNSNRYFTAPTTETEKAEQDALFRKILNESLTFHFWNSLTSSLIPELESLATRLIDHPCIRCTDVL